MPAARRLHPRRILGPDLPGGQANPRFGASARTGTKADAGSRRGVSSGAVGKAKIIVTGVGPTPREIDLGDETIIGRSVRADIQIEGDLVSRQHARIFRRGLRFAFEDLGSRNGTLLNGVRTQSAELKDGDVLNIGFGKIVYQHEDLDSSLEVSFVEGTQALDSAVLSEGEDDSTQATVALSYKDLIVVNQRLSHVARISQQLAQILDRDELLGEAMETLFALFPQADRGCVVLRDGNRGFRVAATKMRAPEMSTSIVMNVSNSLLELVRKERKSVLSADTGHDARFDNHTSAIGSLSRSVMCAPLQREKEFIGAIYLDTESLGSAFKPADLNLLQGVAGPVAIAIKNAELIHRIEEETQLRTNLSRYLSPDLVQQIGEGTLSANLGGEEAEGTVMFSDIVGFTTMSERLSPVEVVDRLNQYFTAMLEAIFGWDGTVDKFGGDAILAVWGTPVPAKDHALLAVAGALEMQARLFVLNMALEEAGETWIRMALGLNSGKFVAGNIGGKERMEWTIIGDAVNTAQRVESQGFRGCVLISDTTHAHLAHAVGGYGFDPVQVKGRTEPVTPYSIRTLQTPRGIVAAIPVEVTLSSETVRGLIVKVHPRGEKFRLTLRLAGHPETGEDVVVRGLLPEHPGNLELSGRVGSSSPLLETTIGRSADIDVNWADEQFAALLNAAGVRPAQRPLESIER